MFHVILYEPEIPPNTGNIIRLCANTGATLSLIGPLGFALDDKKLRRAGLDYREWAQIAQYQTLEACLRGRAIERLLAFSTRGTACYADCSFHSGDALLFGPETRGLPRELLAELEPSQILRIPMQAVSRSLNLSNTVAIVLYEAWRQQGFADGI